MDLQLEGKTALVTGGSRGIGKACARALLAEGASVTILARNEATLDEAAAELGSAAPGRVLAVSADTGDTSAVNAAIARVMQELGGVDILVNNAARPGGAPPKPGIENLPDDGFNEEMNTKVLGYVRCARAVAPSMKERGWGRIINISGLAARQTGNAIGSMRNVAVAALTKNLADELGPFGINVTCVHPGLTWTEAVAETFTRQAGSEEAARERLARSNALQRVIDANDIANVVCFLASPLSVAINGDSIAAGGGVGRAIHY
jgi:NAD(P)-dependent dehydrogenase (short-subunit alcohol dehydrogenase family)